MSPHIPRWLCGAVSLSLAACSDPSTSEHLRQFSPAALDAPSLDAGQVAAFKADIPGFSAVLKQCGATQSVKCNSARRANYEMMFARPKAASSAPQGFRGGSQ